MIDSQCCIPSSRQSQDGDIAKLRSGNKCLETCLAIIESCIAHNVVVALEHPAQSWAWHIPQLRQLLEKKTKGCEIVCSMCAFRARYLKATKVKVWNADSLPDSPARIKCKRCKVPGKRGTICGFTGDAHLSLTGVVKYGNKTAFSTQCAEQYPKAFAEWALRLLTGVMRRRGVRLDLD